MSVHFYRTQFASFSLSALALASTGVAYGQDVTPDASTAVATPDAPDASVSGNAEPSATGEAETPSSTSGGNRLIEEIVVTSQKREENVLDVPISINAFGADQLDARGIVEPKDLPLATPGLTITPQAGFTITYLRGIGSDAFLLADPSVALYVDGVYFPVSSGQSQNLGAVQRIEVLKGPQGTLFGRNAVGGAINVITEAPSFSSASASLMTSYSSYENFQTRAHVNIPLADNLALSMSALYTDENDYRDGTTNGKGLPGETSKGGRMKLRWAPTERLDLTLAGYHMEQDGVGSLFAPNTDPTPILGAAIPRQSADDGALNAPVFSTLDDTVIYGQGTFNTDWFDVKLLGSHQDVKTNIGVDFDGSPMPIASFTAYPFGKIKTAELQLVSNESSWKADRLKWIVGYYYFDGYQGIKEDDFSVGDDYLMGLKQILDPVLEQLGIPPIVSGSLLRAEGFLQTDSNSIFAQASYDITDWFGLTLGLRAQEEKRTIKRSSGSVVAVDGTAVDYLNYSGESDTTRSLAPKVSFDFRPWDKGLIYASYQQAVKSSTFNVINFLRFDGPQSVKKEEMDAYEVGLKTSLFDNSTTVSAAAFYYKLKNPQIQFISLVSGGAVTFENAPEAQVKGIEVDLVTQPLRGIDDGLVFTFSGTYIDSEFTDYSSAQGFDPVTRTYRADLDLTGESLPRTAKVSGSVGLNQALEVPGGTLELGVDYYYNSGFSFLAQSEPFTKQDAYGLLGARVSYLYNAWGLRATLFAKNITDEKYYYSRFVTDFGTNDALAPPAVYGLRLNWDF